MLLAANCKIEPVVIQAIERVSGLPVTLDYIDSIWGKSRHRIRRHFSDFRVACRALGNRQQYHQIIFWQQFIGIYYILLSLLLCRCRLPPAIITTFIFIKRTGLKGKIHHYLIQQVVAAPSIKKIICHSATEKAYYTQQFGEKYADKFTFTPLGAGVGQPSYPIETGDYFFAGGTSNRDYKTLFAAFALLPTERLIVACHPADITGLTISSNIQVIHNVYNDQFLKLMAASRAVIITLQNPNVSAGQLVLLDAMRLQKPTLVSEGNGLEDYSQDHFSMKVKPHDAQALQQAITQLNAQPKRRQQMGLAASETYFAQYSYEKYGERLGEIMLQL